MRLPLWILAAGCSSLAGSVAYASTWEWGLAAGIVWMNVFILTEISLDGVVRELRRMGLRARG